MTSTHQPAPSVISAAPSGERRRRGWDVWAGAGAAAIALVCAAWALKLWDADLSVPFRYSVGDDTRFYLMLVKDIVDHGWVLTNHSLGAPFGQQLFDYPQTADDLNLALLWILAVPFSQIGVVINLFFLITFPLNAASAYYVLRRLGVSTAPSIACAALFALLPYHFFRSDSHLFLSAYYSLPLTALIFVRVLGGEPIFARREQGGSRWRAWGTRRTGGTVLMCAVIASTGLYYAVFGLVMLLAGTLLALVARRGRAAVMAGLSAFAVVLAALIINLSPTIVYELGHGSNAQVQHEAGVGDDLAMSASYLILPPLHDRIAPLRHLTEHYAETTPPHGYCEQCYESIGTVGDVGFLWLGLAALAAAMGAPLLARRRSTQLRAAAGVAVCLAVGVNGGISSLTRVFVTADIRAWNRMSVLIAFFSLLAVGLLLDALRVRLRGRRASVGFGLIVAVVLVIGVVDQTSPFFVPDYARDAGQYHSDGDFTASIERVLPVGASIFQLPYVPFPEGYQPFASPGQTIPFAYPLGFEYEEARPYLQSTGLRWSYGAMKGRAADWPAQLAAQPVTAAVAGAAAAGFDGIEVDLSGYPGTLGDRLRQQLHAVLGVAPLISHAGDLLFYDLRAYAARLRASRPAASVTALRSAVLDPLRLSCATGRLTIVNPGPTARVATLEATATATQPTALRIDFGSGAGAARVITATPQGTRVSQTIRLPSGTTTVTTSAHDPRAFSVSLQSPSVLDSAVAPFAQDGSGALPLGIVGPPCASVGTQAGP